MTNEPLPPVVDSPEAESDRTLDRMEAPLPKSPGRKKTFDFNLVQSVFIKASLVLSIVLVVFFVVHELTDRSFKIQPFSLPANLTEQGYTGELFATSVANDLNAIISIANERRTLNELDEYNESSGRVEVKLEVGGIAVSPEAISSYLKPILGIEQRRISGAVIKTNESLVLVLNVSGQPQQFIEQKLDSMNTHEALGILSLKAAEEILKVHNHLLAGLYYYAENEFDKAIKHFRASIYEQPEYIGTAYAHWGDAFLVLTDGKDTTSVGKLIRKGLEHDPDNSTAYRILGNMYNRFSPEKAEIFYRKSVELDPTSERSWFRLASHLSRDPKNDDEAIASYKNAIELYPKNTYALARLAELLYLKGEYEKASETIQRFQYLEPDYRFSALAQAVGVALSEAAGDSSKTLPSIAEFPDKRFISDELNSIAFNCELRGKYETGFRLVKLSLIADSTYDTPYTTLAELHALTGNKEGFFKYIEKAFQKGFPIEEVLVQDEPYKTMASDERFRKLVEKYR